MSFVIVKNRGESNFCFCRPDAQGSFLFMYAIVFDLNTDALKKSLGESYNNVYKDVRQFLAGRGFSHQQGSLYYGDETVTSNAPALTVFDMARKFSWLRDCVSDIRVLQLLDSDSLKPWVDRGAVLGREDFENEVARLRHDAAVASSTRATNT